MRTFVGITALHDKQGNIHPMVMHWPDGRQWPVDKILDIRKAAAMSPDGHGVRYLCRFANKEVKLFYNGNLWFVEH